MKEWVLGFIILPAHVVLLRKSRTMHIGLWNGLGGKIEEGESAINAMRREGKEECGYDLNWKHVGYLRGENDGEPWRVFVYATTGIGRPVAGFAEITADYADKAMDDTPYRVQFDELSELKLAPHTKTLIYMAQDKVRYPDAGIVQLNVLP